MHQKYRTIVKWMRLTESLEVVKGVYRCINLCVCIQVTNLCVYTGILICVCARRCTNMYVMQVY